MLKVGYSFRFIHNMNNNLNQLLLPLYVLSSIYEFSDGTVEGLLYFRRKDTGGELFKLSVVGDALTAFTLPGAWFITTGAICFVGFNVTIHMIRTPLQSP